MISIPEIDIPLDMGKLSRVSEKTFNLLMRKTKNPVEAYAILLMLKLVFDEEFKFKEEDWKSFVEDLKQSFEIPE